MNSLNTSPLPSVQPDEINMVIGQVSLLHAVGIATVPVCRPLEFGTCSADWHPQPCPVAGKRPLVSSFPSMSKVLPEVEYLIRLVMRFFPCGIAMVVPKGIVVVEGDSPEGEEEVVALGGGATEEAPARERRESRGRGWLFRVDSAVNVRQRAHLGKSRAVDVLPPGAIFVVPPSIHRSGHRIGWVPGRAPWEASAPLIPSAVLQLAMEGSSQKPHSVVPVADAEFTPRISPRVAFLMSSKSRIARLWIGEGKVHGDVSQSGIDFAFAAELSAGKATIREVAEAIAMRPGAHRTDRNYCFKTALAASRRKP